MDTIQDILFSQPRGELVTLLLDGDLVAYRPAAATDGHTYEHAELRAAWKYKKDILEACKEAGVEPSGIKDRYSPEPLQHAISGLCGIINSIETSISKYHDAFVWEPYLTLSKSNFRFNINPEYKKHRADIHKPYWLPACKSHLADKFNARYVAELEADDCIAMRAEELRQRDKPYVVVSYDKDLDQIPGPHFDFVKNRYYTVSEEEARSNLWHQAAVGDTTDNILTPTGIGPSKAKKLFKDVDWVTVKDEELKDMIGGLFLEFLRKDSKTRRDKGIYPNTDETDIRCLVDEVYYQVLLWDGRKFMKEAMDGS